MTKPESALKLLDPEIMGDEQKFRKAISWYEAVMPRPWKHKFHWDNRNGLHCERCNLKFQSKVTNKGKLEEYECLQILAEQDTINQINPCSVPDIFSGSLGDLAFELMSKTTQDYLREAVSAIGREKFGWPGTSKLWIIAALYALEQAEKEKR